MHRTQILLEDWQYDALKALAARRGTSLSAVIREFVTEKLVPEVPAGSSKGSALERIAGIAEGPGDLAENHDHYLYGE